MTENTAGTTEPVAAEPVAAESLEDATQTEGVAAEAETEAPAEDVPAAPAADEPSVVVAEEAPAPEPTAVDEAVEVAGPATQEAEVAEPATPEVEAAEPAAPEAVVAEPTVTPETDTVATEDAPTPETSAPVTPVVPVPAPAARPTPRPVPRPMARPVPHPPSTTARPATEAPALVPPPQDAAEAAAAATFGRVDEDGTVHVREATGERVVGQYPGATSEEALALYVRRYLDLKAKVVLFEARLGATDLSVKEIDQTIARLTEEVAEPAAVGDLDALRERLAALQGVATERRAAAEAERVAAREAALAARTEIVEAAERIAATEPSRIQWRPAGEQLRGLLEQWKEAQRNGPRLDRPSEEALWKRFSHARTTFDRERRHFFAELESRNAEARSAKEALVAEAEALATSTDWGATAGAFRDLMARWKAAGRASRADDDALWARFRSAQDAFFAARDASAAVTDAEFRANLEVKERLLAEAEALLPVTDLAAAKSALRTLQDRWEAAGKVPRADMQRIEGRMRAVETAVRDAEQQAWSRSNPETRARAEGAAAQLEAAIAGLEADLEAAKAKGDKRKVADAQAALDARRAWLEQVQRAAEDSRG